MKENVVLRAFCVGYNVVEFGQRGLGAPVDVEPEQSADRYINVNVV